MKLKLVKTHYLYVEGEDFLSPGGILLTQKAAPLHVFGGALLEACQNSRSLHFVFHRVFSPDFPSRVAVFLAEPMT